MRITIITGYPFKSSQYCDDNNDSVRLLRGDNVAQGFLRWDNAKKRPSSRQNSFAGFLLARGDIILAMDRPWIEAGLKYAWVTDKDLPCLLVQRVARLRGKNGLLTRFLRYVIADRSFTDYIKPIVTGVAVPHISSKQIQDYHFRLPPIETQRKIAAILSAYDDLIENNTRRLKILEEMARALYREWFVHFRFPGHEKVRMVDSPLGEIPEGWEAITVRDISDYINRGISPKYDDKSENIVINQKCIRDRSLNVEPSRRHLNKVPEDKLIRRGDILINSTGVGTLGRVAQIYQELPNCTVDSHVSIVRPGNKVAIDYFGLNLINQQDHFESLGTGSTGQAELNRDSIANLTFPHLSPASHVNKSLRPNIHIRSPIR